MTVLPTGTVTFLFTDIEGSTRLLEAQPGVYRVALARHDAIIREAVTANAGVVFQTRGDGFCAAFASPVWAVQAAFDAQGALWREPWGEDVHVKARMALHTGAVELHGEEYFGAPLHRAARLMDSAHGGQTVLSAVTSALVDESLPAGVWLKDLGEHRLRDLAQPDRIYQLCGMELPADFPPLRTATAAPSRLPPQATAFIGREQQRRSVAETLLRTDARLLTLTGPGGTGKTRLGLQVAADVIDRFRDGVSFVPLGSITDPDLVPSAIAQALDVREMAGRPIVASIADWLRPKELLLVLDNFEQVPGAAPWVAEILTAAPRLKVLVTSRAVLRLYGEREYPVPPLTLPDRRSNPSAHHLAQFEAVRLFVDRAQAARPDFALSDENAADVSEICRRLDGLPLALELAAARIRSLPPRAMLQRMERRLPLLTGGARDLPARQRTLRDAIAWSYELLDADEQTLFRRLGVFWGCSLEAAETVCAGEPPRPGATSIALPPLEIEVLDGLESLVEKSLVRQIAGVDGQPRYTMLETIREYALDRLSESGEADAIHRRHALGALRFAEAAETALYGPEQAPWFARVEQAHDNLRVALRWCEEHGYAALAMRLAVAQWWFWSAHGHVKEGRERVTSLLARFPLKVASEGNPTRVELHAKVLWVAGMPASMQGDHAVSRSLHEESLALRRAGGDLGALFNSLEGLGTVTCFEEDYVAAERYLGEALAIARGLADPVASAMALHALGNVKNELGDLTAARAYYEESLAQLPYSSPLHGPRLSVAAIALDQGRYDEAEALATEALTRFREQGNRHVEALAMATLGGIALARGDQAAAHRRLSESITIQREHGNVPGVAQVLERFAGLAAAQGRLDGAMRIAGAADAMRQRGGGPITPGTRARLELMLGPIRRALSTESADEAWHQGRLLDLDEAVAAALSITASLPASAEPPAVSTPGPGVNGAASILTRREQEVAVLIAQGLTNRQIAERLVITEGTAANHVVHILNKLGYGSRAQVAAWATERGLTSGA